MANIVAAEGRLTADPFISRKNPDCPVARYTLAVMRNYSSESTDFLPCVCFGESKVAYVEKNLAKGMRICVFGTLESGSYKNADGNKVYTIDIIVDTIEYADSKEEDDEYRRRKSSYTPTKDSDASDFVSLDEDDENLPFA